MFEVEHAQMSRILCPKAKQQKKKLFSFFPEVLRMLWGGSGETLGGDILGRLWGHVWEVYGMPFEICLGHAS